MEEQTSWTPLCKWERQRLSSPGPMGSRKPRLLDIAGESWVDGLDVEWNYEEQNMPLICGDYPLVMTNIAIENDHRHSGFTHETW